MTRHLVVVGAQRCGTTYVHDLLAAHPDIAMARPARPEPKAFLSDEVLAEGLEGYRRRWFGHAGDAAVLGEKSTSYLESATAPARIATVLGAPQILVQLRDPVARAVSNWAFSTEHGVETRPLAEALAASLEGPLPWDGSTTSVSPFAYLERGRYAEQLAPWLEAFPGLVRVQLLEDLVADPDVVGDLYGWLGVDAAERPDVLGRPVNTSAPAEGGDTGLAPDLVAALRAHFRDHDAALERLLGRPLPWPTTSTEASPA